MIADAASKRDDVHSKELAEKESLLIDQARRLSELKEQLEAQSSAAAASGKALSESVDMQPYSASDAELQKVLAKAKMAKHGITEDDELKVAIWQLLSPMPGFPVGSTVVLLL
jgi:CRISPR/Cas system-associated protein Csm6